MDEAIFQSRPRLGDFEHRRQRRVIRLRGVERLAAARTGGSMRVEARPLFGGQTAHQRRRDLLAEPTVILFEHRIAHGLFPADRSASSSWLRSIAIPR